MTDLLHRLRLLDRYGVSPLGFVVGGFVALVVGCLIFITAYVNIEGRACAVAAEQMQRDTRWDFWAGCFVQKADGTYVSLDTYRLTDNEEEE